MSKRSIIFRALLVAIAVSAMVIGPVMAGSSRSCMEVAPCCSVQPEIEQGCCGQDHPADDPGSRRHDLCDCDHGSGPVAVSAAISSTPTETLMIGAVSQDIEVAALVRVESPDMDEYRGPPGPSLFLLDCTFLI